MSDRNCSACGDLREYAPEFTQNGTTSKVCSSLHKDTGFNPDLRILHTDEDDLHDANDCLIGNMADEIESYDVCDWKEFMKNFIPNLYELLKAIICSIGGIWTKVHKLECEVDYLYNGQTFRIGEDTSGDAYAVAGKGVSFLLPQGEEAHKMDLGLQYIAGGLMRGYGTYVFSVNDFTDRATCGNFDNGSTYRESMSRKGNSIWGTDIAGTELVSEFRLKKSVYKQIETLYSGFGQEIAGKEMHICTSVFTEGKYAYGQHGQCDPDTGAGEGSGDNGHLVPNGWVYIQVRISSAAAITNDKTTRSLKYFMGVRMNQSKLDC